MSNYSLQGRGGAQGIGCFNQTLQDILDLILITQHVLLSDESIAREEGSRVKSLRVGIASTL